MKTKTRFLILRITLEVIAGMAMLGSVKLAIDDDFKGSTLLAFYAIVALLITSYLSKKC